MMSRQLKSKTSSRTVQYKSTNRMDSSIPFPFKTRAAFLHSANPDSDRKSGGEKKAKKQKANRSGAGSQTTGQKQVAGRASLPLFWVQYHSSTDSDSNLCCPYFPSFKLQRFSFNASGQARRPKFCQVKRKTVRGRPGPAHRDGMGFVDRTPCEECNATYARAPPDMSVSMYLPVKGPRKSNGYGMVD